jgi:glycosyltransferase involved in cell wall biosynthesis
VKPGSRLAIYHPPGRIGPKANPFGKDVANLQLYRALARHGGYARVDLLSNLPVADADVAEDLFPDVRPPCQVAGGSVLSVEAPAEGGILFRGQPDLESLAWIRRKATGDRGYSLAGLIHTLAPPAMRQIIAGALTSPAQEIRDKADRLGARARVRSDLGIEADEVLVVWVGRLSFFEKAFPQPMFRAVEEAGRLAGKRMHFALAGWFPGGEADRARYEQAAAAYAPSVQVDFQDGNDPEVVADLWAAGDIFLSLVDNIQETFGITPLEAMAAGLPVVASDWDGYRFTVRHGVEGFLIPTLGGPPGALGEALSARHAIGLDSYQSFVGAVAQHTAVHVGRAAEAIAELTRNPELRRRMGAAGRVRVREAFDWPVVVRQLTGLFEELAALRAATPGGAASHRLHPLRGDPFADFAGFATHDLGLDRRLRLRPGAGASDLARSEGVELDGAFRMWRAAPEEVGRVVELLAGAGELSVRDVLLAFPVERRRAVQMSLVWLAKIGVVDWL